MHTAKTAFRMFLFLFATLVAATIVLSVAGNPAGPDLRGIVTRVGAVLVWPWAFYRLVAATLTPGGGGERHSGG
jgi:hypothetical protein